MKKATKEPDRRTRQLYNERGYHVVKSEAYVYIPGITQQHRRDFLGIFDYLAFNDEEIVGIQTTTKHNMNDRRKKMLSRKSFAWWTSGKHRRAILHGWYKNSSNRWDVVEDELTMEDWYAMQEKIEHDAAAVDPTKTALYGELAAMHGDF